MSPSRFISDSLLTSSRPVEYNGSTTPTQFACPTPTPALQPTCPDEEPLIITCKRGLVSLSEEDADLLDAVSARYLGDQSANCRRKLYLLHSAAVEHAGGDATRVRGAIGGRSGHDVAPVIVSCRKGHLTVSEPDPDVSEAATAVFQGDGTRKCREFVYKLHQWAQELPAT